MRRYSMIVTAAAVLASTEAVGPTGPSGAPFQPPTAEETGAAVHREVLDRYCATCHNARIVRGETGGASPLAAQLRAAGLMLDTLELGAVAERAEVWERVVRKLRAGMMPPAGRPRLEPRVLDDLETVRAVFPHSAFTKTFSHGRGRWKESNRQDSPSPTRRRAWRSAGIAIPDTATACADAPTRDAPPNRRAGGRASGRGRVCICSSAPTPAEPG